MISYNTIVGLMENLQDLIYVMEYRDQEFYYSYVNSKGLHFLGNPSQLIGKRFDEVLSPKRAGKLKNRYMDVIHQRKPLSFQESLMLESNKEMHAESLLSPIFDENNQVTYIISITRDMTERYNERLQMKESEQRYKSLYEQNIDGIFTLDENGIIIEMNDASKGILGYKNNCLIGTSILDLVQVSSIKAFYSAISPTLLGKPSQLLNCEFIHCDGTNLTVYLKTAPIVIEGRVEGIYLIIRDISKQEESERKIKFLAVHDELTGLYNRKALIEHTERGIAKNQLRKTEFAVMLVDIDRFKIVNDVLGHQLGDKIIIEFANRLKEVTTKNVKIFRMGGDEFAILMETATQRDAAELATKVMDAFKTPIVLNQKEYYMSCTIGISMYASDGENAECLIKNAAIALHRGKEYGRGRYQFYNSHLHHQSPRKMILETSLRKSIQQKELVLHYQPQVDLKTEQLCGLEALIRWDSQEYGMVSPAEFIPMAEETGYILEIGDWVIHEVCRQIREWLDNGLDVVPVGINLSPKQFLSSSLFETIQSALIENRVAPSLLTIEVTETAMMDPRRALKILEQLKEIGMRISIDDFGTGYSSFSYLKKFPIDILKIDQSFIKEISSADGKDAAITTSLIQLAQLLGLDVVAEGVETLDQVDFLKSNQCLFCQGYFYSKPLQSTEIEKQFLKQ